MRTLIMVGLAIALAGCETMPTQQAGQEVVRTDRYGAVVRPPQAPSADFWRQLNKDWQSMRPARPPMIHCETMHMGSISSTTCH